MALSQDLISAFVKATNDTTIKSGSTIIYGTARKVDGSWYVVADGSEQLIPITSTATVSDGDRVTMTIENHTAIVTGNLTDQSASTSQYTELSGTVDDLNNTVIEMDNYIKLLNNVINIADTELDVEESLIKIENGEVIIQGVSVNSLNDTVNTQDNTITAIQNDISVLQSTIDTQNSTIETINSTISVYNSSFVITDGYITGINGIDLDELNAKVAEIDETYITQATIEILTSDLADITSILAGNIGTGTLQSIHLTSDNVVIDDAVITSAMVAELAADKITSGTIYTDLVKIANNTGENLLIDGSTIQFKDANSIYRIQIGEDASGDYNMYIWDASENLLWDALGLTEAGLTGNGAIIKDTAVADDAAISGYKLDIASVAERLNADGSITVDYANVKINDTTLDYELTSITTAANEAAAAAETAQELAERLSTESVTSITQYYAIGDSADTPPSDPAGGAIATTADEEDIAIVGTAVVGTSVIGTADAVSTDWTTTYMTPSDGEYLWTAFYVVYVDGGAEWTTPTCLSDGVARDKTTTLETELKVVQGQITAKVWQTDIDTAVDDVSGEITTLQDQYSTMTETIDGITTEVGDITTTLDGDGTTVGLISRVATVEETASGITSRVESVESTLSGVDSVTDYVASEFSQLANSISMSVTGGLGSTASIVMTVNGTSTEQNLDLTGVRNAFANDTSEITISAGIVTFNTGTLIVNSDEFTLDENGNASLGGTLNAPTGTLGGFTIGKSSIFYQNGNKRLILASNKIEASGGSTYVVDDVTLYPLAEIYGGIITLTTDGYSAEDSPMGYTEISASGYNGFYLSDSAWINISNTNQYVSINSDGEFDNRGTTNLYGKTNMSGDLAISGTTSIYGTITLKNYIDAIYSSTPFRHEHFDTGYRVQFGVGANGYTRGIYDAVNGEWIIDVNTSDNTAIYAPQGDIVLCMSGYTRIRPYDTDLTVDNTGTVLHVYATTSAPTSTSSSDSLLVAGMGTTGGFLRSYATYARTTTTAANMVISSSGNLARYSSSSARYKNSANYFTNLENASEEGLSIWTSGIEYVDFRKAMRSVLDIPVVQFHYNEGYITNEDYDYTQYVTGFIAEDIEKICPEAAVYNEDGTIEAWNHMQLIPRMLYVIQEQEARITELENALLQVSA